MRSVITSTRSLLVSCKSERNRHIKANPELTSMRLSNPKPTSAILPAISPEITAISPSRQL
jgi:hypothetical protein